MVLPWRVLMACWIEGNPFFASVNGIIGQEMVVVAVSDEPVISMVEFQWRGAYSDQFNENQYVKDTDGSNYRWTSRFTPTQLGQISLSVNFYIEFGEVYQTREASGTIAPSGDPSTMARTR